MVYRGAWKPYPADIRRMRREERLAEKNRELAATGTPQHIRGAKSTEYLETKSFERTTAIKGGKFSAR